MSTEILSDQNLARVSAKVVARAKPFTDLDLRFKPHPNFGDVVPLNDIAAVKNAIKSIILTSKGEKPFQPKFGSNVTSYLFEQPDPITISLLENEIKTVIARYEPRVAVQDVNIEDRTEENGLFISVSVVLITTKENVDVELFLERTR